MASASSLLRSAASIRNQLASYQDAVMAYEYKNSAYTDSAYSTYSAYLKSRISALSASGSISDASKALTLTNALDSAGKSNISATIQRENIQVLAGNATLQDKYNVVVNQFNRAQANGDMTLAQTLEGQAYSLYQSIKVQNQQAADAQAALDKANATKEGDIVSNLKSGLEQLNTTLEHTGQKDFNTVINKWVSDNQATFNSLGVNIPKNAQPNYWDVVNGVMGAMYNHEVLAHDALVNTDPYEAQKHMDAAKALFDGSTPVPTLAGNRNAQEIQSAAANPSQFVYDGTTGKFIEAQHTGFQYTPNGIVNTYNGSINKPVFLNASQTAQMAKLGLNFSENANGTTGDGVRVQASQDTPQWLRNVLGENGVTNMYALPDGSLQFKFDSVSGSGQALYTIKQDGSTWESSALGDKLINSPAAPSQPTSIFGRIGEAFMSGVKQVDTLINPTASADALPSYLLSEYAGPKAFPQSTIPVATPTHLPSLSIAQPQIQQTLAVAKPAPTIAAAVAPAAVSPQKAATGTTVQSGSSGISLQGSGLNLQGGGFSLQ